MKSDVELVDRIRRRLAPEGKTLSIDTFASIMRDSAWIMLLESSPGSFTVDPSIRKRLEALDECIDAMGDMVRPEDRAQFFLRRHPLLNGKKPADLLPHEKGLVLGRIEAASSGTFS